MSRRLTIDDLPTEVMFVDEEGQPFPEYGSFPMTPFFGHLVLTNARRWKQSIDTTLERMFHKALRDFISAHRKAAP